MRLCLASLVTLFGLTSVPVTPLIAGGLGVTPPDQFSVPDGFVVELVHEVPAPTQGSWVSLTVDPKDRLIACDQYGGLFRIDLSDSPPQVSKLDIDFEGAQGLLCAFGSLYANVNLRGGDNGLWRLTDTDGDDQYDTKECIIPLNGGSEHGPHGIVLSPDGEQLIFVAGNNTDLPDEFSRSRVPKTWDEDHLLGRMPDARGHNATRMAPGGFIMSCLPDGSDRELIATGFRNPYDIALDRNDELFAYDADMEWDVGTPWYRPTRVNHVISGAEFGWRNGTGKWPKYYADSFGSAVDIGPGSPTGIVFGYGAAFPEKYQNALFIADWSYGNIHAVTLTEDGSSYGGTYETFATAAPLPVTDMVIHPDGAMYVTIGGRRTQSGLYRIRYVGDMESDGANASSDKQFAQTRSLRHQLESLHSGEPADSADLELVFEHLGNSDRGIRYAARIALEHKAPSVWKDRILGPTDLSNEARLNGLIALARHGSESDQDSATTALLKMSFESLSPESKIAFLRAAALITLRLGDFDTQQRGQVIHALDGQFPSGNDSIDRELALMLVYLQAPGATESIVEKLKDSPSQESQIHYAMALRRSEEGWTEPLRRTYLEWFTSMKTAKGGRSFGGFVDNIKKEVVASLSGGEKQRLADAITPPKTSEDAAQETPRAFVKSWSVDDLVDLISPAKHQPNYANGKAMFAAAQCYKCHRMGLQGGILGPDLTSAGGKFNARDMLTSIIEPSRVISDQYGATQFLTEDGKIVTGRVVNMRDGSLTVMTNMLAPSSTTTVHRDEVIETAEATVSMMPSGLLDTLTAVEIADLVAYLRAGGNANHLIYTQPVANN